MRLEAMPGPIVVVMIWTTWRKASEFIRPDLPARKGIACSLLNGLFRRWLIPLLEKPPTG